MVGFCEQLPSHPTTISASPTQLLVGQLTRLPFHSGYATVAIRVYISSTVWYAYCMLIFVVTVTMTIVLTLTVIWSWASTTKKCTVMYRIMLSLQVNIISQGD